MTLAPISDAQLASIYLAGLVAGAEVADRPGRARAWGAVALAVDAQRRGAPGEVDFDGLLDCDLEDMLRILPAFADSKFCGDLWGDLVDCFAAEIELRKTRSIDLESLYHL